MISSSSSSAFTVLAEDVVDEGLTLLLARGTGVPRLGIYNTVLDKKKYIHLAWVESESRTLRVKTGRVSGKDYPVEVIHESVHRLIEKVRGNLNMRALVWNGVKLLGDLLHMPRMARNETECMLVPDAKKDTLWYSYRMNADLWHVHPCFVETSEEHVILDRTCTVNDPWRSLPLGYKTLPCTLRSERFIKELSNSNQKRWNALLFPVAKALVFGFSEWGPDGDHPLGDALWCLPQGENARSDDGLLDLQKKGQFILPRLVGYLRLWPLLSQVNHYFSDDVPIEAEKNNLKRKERFDGVIKGRNFRVTRFNDEKMTVNVFGFVPAQRLPGEKDQIIEIDNASWELAVEACSFGGQMDTYYTAFSLIESIEVKKWLDKILPFVEL